MAASTASNTLPLWGTFRLAFRAYRKQARWLLGLGFLETLLFCLTSGLLAWALRSKWPVFSWGVIGLLGLFLLAQLEVVRNTAALQILGPQPLSWRSLLHALKRTPQYVLTMGFLTLPVLVVTAAIGGIVLFMVDHGSLLRLGEFPGWKISVLVSLELVWLLLLGWWWFSFHLAPYVIIEGTTGLWKPIATSWGLLAGKKGRLLGAYVLAFGVALVVVTVPFFLLQGWVRARGVDASLRASWLWIPTCVTSGVLVVLVLPWLGVVQAAFYRVLAQREHPAPTNTSLPPVTRTPAQSESTERLLKRYEESMKQKP